MVPFVLLNLATLDLRWRPVHELAPLLIPGLDPDTPSDGGSVRGRRHSF